MCVCVPIVQIESALGVSPESLYKDHAASLKAVAGAKEDGGFKLRQRAIHVYEEAQRVRDFKAVCDVSVVSLHTGFDTSLHTEHT